MFNKSRGMIKPAHALAIVEAIIKTGEVGLFSWHVESGKMEIIELITGKQFDNISSLPQFIDQVVIEKDRDLAKQDLDAFMKGTSKHYKSTFRILDKTGKVRWLFCKGGMLTDKRLGVLIYDVTGGNFRKGNDPTTGFLRGEHFLRKLKNALNHAERHQQKGALIYIDIENLMTIINTYGFDFASEVIGIFSEKLSKLASEQDELARLPHDKFMVLLSNIKSVTKVEKISQKILEEFKNPFTVRSIQMCLKLNMGITFFPELSTDADELMRFSDFALGYSRTKGGQTATFFDSDLMETYIRKKDIEHELPHAIVNDELSLVFQPQFNVQTNRISGIEALIRWKNPKLGFVSPAEFIPIAEDNSYIIQLGKWVAEASLRTARKWLDKGFDFNKISINVSPVELLQKDFREILLKKCAAYNILPSIVELEITERILMSTTDANKETVNTLLNDGFSIALDDYGTGHSNISYLLQFNISTLKLDKFLVENIMDKRWQYIIKNIIGFQQFASYDIVAEGVERKEEVEELIKLGCHTIQGYYFSKPLPMDEIEVFLAEHH